MSRSLNVMLPMAGLGKRFAEAGYEVPKPFIDVAGMPMVERVLRNVPPHDSLYLLALEEHRPYVEKWVSSIIRAYPPREITMQYLAEVTQGSACTVLEAEGFLPDDGELLVVNCDQWNDYSAEHFLSYVRRMNADGAVLTFRGSGTQFSYLQQYDDGVVSAVAEKEPISRDALAGHFYWREAQACFKCIRQMIDAEQTVNGEYYLAPAFNQMILAGARVLAYQVARHVSMNTPEDLKEALVEGVFA